MSMRVSKLLEQQADTLGINVEPTILPAFHIPLNCRPELEVAEITDAMEFLQYVQLERERCLEGPMCMSVSSEKKVRKAKSSGIVFPDELKKEFLSEFANVRSQLQAKMPELAQRFPISNPDRLPHKADMLSWCAFCLGDKALSQVRNSALGTGERCEYGFDAEGYPPFLRFVLNLSKGNVNRLLWFFGIWLKGLGFSQRQGQWIYALFSVVQMPCSESTSKALLNLLEVFTGLRKKLKTRNLDAIIPVEAFIYILKHHFNIWKLEEEINDHDIRYMTYGVDSEGEDESGGDADDSEDDSDDSGAESNESDMET